MGRDRIHADNAEKQRAYRQRRAEELEWLRAEVERLRRGGAAKVTKRRAVSTKLVKVLGMLGSDHMGERATAADMASRMLKEAGLTWYDVLDIDEPPRKK
jgi:hypothetical protein